MNKKSIKQAMLCGCGHPLSSHNTAAGCCYASMRRKERRRNHLGKYVMVRCSYTCYCTKFEKLREKKA